MKRFLSSLPPFMQHAAVKFASVGVVNTVFSIAIIFGLKWIGATDVAANFLGYVAGVILSFILNKKWTFSNTQSTLPAFLRFLVVFAISYAINLGIVLIMIHVGVNAYFSHLVGMPIYSIVFYFGCRYFAFADRSENART